MIRLTSVINAFQSDLLARYGSRLNADQRRALAAMKRCRNQASLKMQVCCEDCEHLVFVSHSCGNRHCPHCQHHESEQWLARQRPGNCRLNVSGKPAALYRGRVRVGTISTMFNTMEIGHGWSGRKTIT